MIELKPCPLCNTADNIHLYRHYPNTIKRYEYGCDCGFFTPSAITKRGAARRWNSYVKVWKNGFDECYSIIMAELNRKIEEMNTND